MPDERMAHTVAALSDVFGLVIGPKWFVSFGSLLWFVRDRLLGRPLEQDIDVSLEFGTFPRDHLISRMLDYNYKLSGEVLDNHLKYPLQMTFSPSREMYPVDIDVYFWVIGKKFAWHTYDVNHTKKIILNEYVFKGVPADYITAPTVSYVWEEIAPEVKFPSMYGSLLDYWYPPKKGTDGKFLPNTGWMVQDKQYGQSQAAAVKTLKTCKNMAEVLG